jgi:hypothetical protein
MDEIVIQVYQGIVECKSRPANIKVVLHDYDILEFNHDNPDAEFEQDELGPYEVREI